LPVWLPVRWLLVVGAEMYFLTVVADHTAVGQVENDDALTVDTVF